MVKEEFQLKFIRIVVCFVFLLGFLAGAGVPFAQATENPSEYGEIINQEVIPQDDGGVIIVTTYRDIVLPYAMSYQQVGTKRLIGRNASGVAQYEFILHGTFEVTRGVRSVCINASHDYEIYNSDWRYISGTSHFNANKAFGDATFKEVVDFITGQTVDVDLVLTCDENGNLS